MSEFFKFHQNDSLYTLVPSVECQNLWNLKSLTRRMKDMCRASCWHFTITDMSLTHYAFSVWCPNVKNHRTLFRTKHVKCWILFFWLSNRDLTISRASSKNVMFTVLRTFFLGYHGSGVEYQRRPRVDKKITILLDLSINFSKKYVLTKLVGSLFDMR